MDLVTEERAGKMKKKDVKTGSERRQARGKERGNTKKKERKRQD